MNKKAAVLVLVFPVFFCLLGEPALAHPEQIKAYKAAYEGAKPKCIWCHAIEKPKKEDGMHELSEYGKKAKALIEAPENKMPGEEIYKTIGKNPQEEE